MAVWFDDVKLERIREWSRNTIDERIGVEYTEIGDDYLRGRMPVDERTVQPYGLLHGGASVVLAESLGSAAANLCVDPVKRYCVGIEVNANHVRSARSGYVTGTARPIHIGGVVQVWEIRIEDEAGRLTCISRLTLAVLERQGE